jgi:hypothetical protein
MMMSLSLNLRMMKMRRLVNSSLRGTPERADWKIFLLGKE